MATDGTPTDAALPTGWRLRLGLLLFPLTLIPYGLLVPVVAYGLPVATVASLVGAGVILQKVLFVGTVAVLGKPGFAFLRRWLFSRIAPQTRSGPRGTGSASLCSACRSSKASSNAMPARSRRISSRIGSGSML
ncbi:hypothetical protein OPKNFCMD_6636 [Methylobacterium crusticola]|uniref:Uncharacterized protein n=1 Tax=Methylobacterium crusticola TaxID=1697972 RepID=A0ABQ4RAX3_9HYPH|nr:hypothetical protein OPKNFCMD_6636 [Methylobacterium crusticola]